MNEQTDLLREIRDLLKIIAEPELAKLDVKRRSLLRDAVGRSQPKAKAVLLMDGTRNQTAIRSESGIDAGDLSRLVKALRASELVSADEKHPKLVLSVPANFFESREQKNG